MPWKTFDNDAAFYRFMGHAGSTIPISRLPQSARDAMRERQKGSEQPQEHDPNEQAHEPPIDKPFMD